MRALPTVDMVIAVHDLRRDVRRAVRSVLLDDDPTIRALVVAHNLPAADVRAAIGDLIELQPDRIRVVDLMDGVRSPSGPFNLGMRESDADYVGIMGSDDELDPRAVTEWREVAMRKSADAVIAKVVRGDQRSVVRSPPKRVWKSGPLDFAKDRLSYRSAPLGLIRRDAIDRLDLRLQEKAGNGGDLPFVTRLWLLGRVFHAQGVAAYVEHADAPLRVTWAPKPIAEEHGSVRDLLASTFVWSLSRADREALGTKLLRRNVMDSIRKRDAGRTLTERDLADLKATIELILRYSPRSRWLLSRALADLVGEVLSPAPDVDEVVRLDAVCANPRDLRSILPARLRFFMHRQAQPRHVAATALIKIGASRYLPAARLVAGTALSATAMAIGGLLLGRSRRP